MGLRAEVVDLVGLDRRHRAVERRRIGEIAGDQAKPGPRFVVPLQQVVDPARITRLGRRARQTPDVPTFAEQLFRKVGAVLAGHSRDQRPRPGTAGAHTN